MHHIVCSNRNPNTERAYEPTEMEWRDYCDHRFCNTPPEYRYTVDKTRVYEFMLYQIFREQKGHGQRLPNTNKRSSFNAAEFDQLIGRYSQQLQSANPTDWYDFQQPNDPLGFSQINIYKCALVNMLREQQALNVNNLSWTTDI